jgi:hypothetical protein
MLLTRVRYVWDLLRRLETFITVRGYQNDNLVEVRAIHAKARKVYWRTLKVLSLALIRKMGQGCGLYKEKKNAEVKQ